MEQFCQSCMMPLAQGKWGTNADGSDNPDYCEYCYKGGKFMSPDETMEEMIESCIPHVVPHVYPDAEAARKSMLEAFPKLKRWQ
jgi:hypothetical protein